MLYLFIYLKCLLYLFVKTISLNHCIQLSVLLWLFLIELLMNTACDADMEVNDWLINKHVLTVCLGLGFGLH